MYECVFWKRANFLKIHLGYVILIVCLHGGHTSPHAEHAHSVPETGLIVTIAMRGHVPVWDSSHGPHPSSRDAHAGEERL